MENNSNKHVNYELLNLLGYGLAKFGNSFVKEFGFETKSSFFEYFVNLKIVETASVVKNRMDLFDSFFDNGRKGWWQKGDAYIHRKHLIDSLFGNENITEYANIVKLYLKDNYKIKNIIIDVKPLIRTRFKKLQETGLEAELYFLNNYQSIDIFKNGLIDDARLYGDGYDFQITVAEHSFLTEVKGIRTSKGKFRLTENEYQKAREYQNDYIIALVMNLDNSPFFLTIDNPLKTLKFEERILKSKEIKEYYLKTDIC